MDTVFVDLQAVQQDNCCISAAAVMLPLRFLAEIATVSFLRGLPRVRLMNLAMWRISVTKPNGWLRAFVVLLVCAAAVAATAQTFTTLFSFDRTNGNQPWSLVQGLDGNFYGTTLYGGTKNRGTAFKISSSGALTTLYSFRYAQPASAGMILASDGNFYGGTNGGGTYHGGEIYGMSASGTVKSAYSFCALPNCADGYEPRGLVQGTDGDLYGTTFQGGGNGGGTVYKLNANGDLSTLYNFCAQTNCTDGAQPFWLIEGSDGKFYGTTVDGGQYANGAGTVFQVTANGTMTTLHSFCAQTNCTDGYAPQGLVQGIDGYFYGTTYWGGANGQPLGGYGTIYKISSSGTMTTLYNFCAQANCTDGGHPGTSPIQATDGNFYGTTTAGGANNVGTIYSLTPGGTLTTLYSFCSQPNCVDGEDALSELLQGTDGLIYGTLITGGTEGFGTVFSFNVGLGPFVAFVRDAGKVGQTGDILGQGLTGTSGVSFNGTPASFTVVSDTYIKATVPAGATTGYVTVATPSGTLTSNVPFQVIP
jgi:uncharacterized repeat protein (TIGR03803 family)